MTDFGRILINALLGASVLLLLPMVLWLLRGFWRVLKKIYVFINKKAKFKAPEHRHTVSKGLLFACLIFLSITCIRYAVGYYSNYYELKTDVNPNRLVQVETPNLNYFELFPDSLLNALQTFSMDADYEECIVKGKEMIRQAFGNEPWLESAYGVYCSVLSGAAPIIGGAIIFEIIAGFFPSVRLRLVRFTGFWLRWRNMNKKKKKWVSLRKRFYFSNLNERSLALAKDIYNSERRWLALVFCDVDNANENLIAQAKHIGGICVKKDIVSAIGKSRTEKTILLMNDCENENLRALTSLLEVSTKSMENIEMYVFSDDNNVSHIDDEVAYIIKQRLAKKGVAEEELPIVIPVDSTRNIAQNLLRDLPLYEPVVGREKDKIVVTIFGSGVIGTQLFFSTYWCGQMLGKELLINIVSKEAEGDFKGRIDSINPDIFKTEKYNDNILAYNDAGDKSPAYFHFDYVESDVAVGSLSSLLYKNNKNGKLINSDYFIVALGSDEDNFAVADQLKRDVGAHHIYTDTQSNTVITYVIYNSELCRALNIKPKHNFREKGKTDVFMWAFGCMDDVYSSKNVFFSEILADAENIGKIYFTRSEQQKAYATMYKDAHKKNESKKIKRVMDAYSHKADLARSLHLKYKAFSAGCVNASVFTVDKKKDYDNANEATMNAYVDKVKFKINIKNDIGLLHELAWLEHRRWNAFMRVCGFRCPEGDFIKYENVAGDHKNLMLKLHPCIVECNKSGINAAFDARGVVIKESALKCGFQNEDLLDQASEKKKPQGVRLEKSKRAKKKEGYIFHRMTVFSDDFKYWDYPMCAINGGGTEGFFANKDMELLKYLGKKPSDMGTSLYKLENKWYIAEETYYDLSCEAIMNKRRYKKLGWGRVCNAVGDSIAKYSSDITTYSSGTSTAGWTVNLIEADVAKRIYEDTIKTVKSIKAKNKSGGEKNVRT